MTIAPYGPDALLIEFASEVSGAAFELGQRLIAAIQADPPAGLTELTPAFASLLLEFDRPLRREDWSPWWDQLRQGARAFASGEAAPQPLHEIQVRYNGPDLERVASFARLSVDEVVSRHSRPVYHVYCLGFAPGFAYLGDLDPLLRAPRLDTPRPRIPKGSVAIGGEHTGVYPIDSPGGWNLIGTTEAVLFSPEAALNSSSAEAAFLLHPGHRVRFVPIPEAP